MLSGMRFKFLNEICEVSDHDFWNGDERSKLWAYNLHYFDDLNSDTANERHEWHCALIDRWIRENPTFRGVGWDSYPTSLRIVNWIKWASRGNELEEHCLRSLALQARHLRKNIEYHILANHLLANAKALVFAGVFFEGDEADEWLKKGCSILKAEISEQVLPDGGHFERSPMYHSIVLEDLLDLVNLLESNADLKEVPGTKEITTTIRSCAEKMTGWLRGMSHPDGQISFFNDAALGIAPAPEALFDYAHRLGIEVDSGPAEGLSRYTDSGYLRFQKEPLVALLDVAPVGPDYQPGHAHADTLSFELSLFGQRVFVNSGTSLYELSGERHRQRSTLAHNTVEIDGENSSEVWHSFRVARRAYPRNLEIEERDRATRIGCEHDGYRRMKGRPVHRREWMFEENSMTVVDEVIRTSLFGKTESRPWAASTRDTIASFHLHPDVGISRGESQNQFELHLIGGQKALFESEGGEAVVEESTWHPEFGLSIPNKVIRCHFDGTRIECRISWNPV